MRFTKNRLARMTTPVSVGIVGDGYWGSSPARNLSSRAGTCLNAVGESDAERLGAMRQVHPDAAAFTSCSRKLAEAEPDAVVIATQPQSHHSLAKTCLLADKLVLVEKLMAHTYFFPKWWPRFPRLSGILAAGGSTPRFQAKMGSSIVTLPRSA